MGILGGSFDPIHHGHLRLAQEALQRLDLEQVLLVPARPWQRATEAGDAHRLRMVELACSGNPGLAAEALELQNPGPSYTVNTLDRLRTQVGSERHLWLVLGADAFLRLPSWYQWERLETLCHLAIVPRPGSDIKAGLPPELAAWWARRTDGKPRERTGALALLEVPELGISATSIRHMLRAGKSPRYLLPDRVLDYIEVQGLYPQEGHGA